MEATGVDDFVLTPQRLAEANIHPDTRLATDYLNHFNEVVMLIDMLPVMPECVSDVLDWSPCSYPEHFRASHFKHRDLAIAAYDAVEPERRKALEATIGMLDQALLSVQRMIANEDLPIDHTIMRVTNVAEHQIKPLLEHASGLINGAPVSDPEPADPNAVQMAIDALFE